ncbi:ImmA/IrrE family metallo-endopeptidase [Leucobacter sp. HY1910]
MSNMKRQAAGTKQAGVSVGGQFAASTQTEASGAGLLLAERELEQAGALNEQFDSLEEKIAAMSSEVESAVENLKHDEDWNNYLTTMSKFHRYSLANQLLIARQMPDATRVGGKTLWKSLDREVLPYDERGRGIAIFRPRIGWVDKKDAQGNVITGLDGKPKRERAVFGYSSATIYDVSQTSGAPLPDGTPELTETPPPGFEGDLTRAIEKLGYPVSEEEIPGTAKGYTSINKVTGEKRVVVAAGLTPADKARVLAHELGHIAAGHMEKEHDGDYHTGAGGKRGEMEVEADSISHVLLRMNGMDPTPSTGRYVAGWAKVQSDNPNVVKDTAANVQKVVKTLIDEHEWANVDLPEQPAYVPKKRTTARKPRKAKP